MVGTIFYTSLAIALVGFCVYEYRKSAKTSLKAFIKKGKKMVVLRRNSPKVRELLKEKGLNLCVCSYNFTNTYLYTEEDGALICGFNESSMHLMSDAIRCGMIIVDCGYSVSKFIDEVEKLKKEK